MMCWRRAARSLSSLQSLIAAGLFVVGFSSHGAAASFDETELLRVIAKKGVDSHLSSMVDKASALSVASVQLCEAKDEKSLRTAQDAWKGAYLSWRKAGPYLIGPAQDLSLDSRLGRWISNDTVMEAVTSSEEYKYLRDNSEMRGYAAAEYILFTAKDSKGAATTERCEHLLDVTQEISWLTSEAKNKWDTEFREGFVTAGNGLPYMIPGDALSLVGAEILNSTEVLLRDRIGLPSNFFQKNAKPELLEAWHSKASRDALQAAFTGIRNALEGDDTVSILNLLATKDGMAHKKDPAHAKKIHKQLSKIQKSFDKLNSKNTELYTALQDDPAKLKKLYKQLQKLQDLVVEAVLILELEVKTGLEAQLAK